MQTRPQQVIRAWIGVLAGVCLLFSAGVMAQRVEGDPALATGSYATEVPVYGQGDAIRKKAFAKALAQVLSTVTGDPAVAGRPGVAKVLKNAERYVDHFDYRQDAGDSVTGMPSYQTKLVVRFGAATVDGLVQMLGLAVWPQPRPKPVLWLAIDDGSGPRLVGLAQVGAVRSLLDQAKQHGYALGLPAGSAAEQSAVGAIWRGDVAAVAALSKRYSPPMQLIGKLYRGNAGWVADWVFVDAGKVLARWQNKDANALQAMAGGADGAAEALFDRYAKVDESAAPGRYRVRVLGVDDASDYLRLAGYLGGMAGVRGVIPVLATPGALELDLELLGDIGKFTRFIQEDDVLLPAAEPAGADALSTTAIPADLPPGGAGRVLTLRLNEG